MKQNTDKLNKQIKIYKIAVILLCLILVLVIIIFYRKPKNIEFRHDNTHLIDPVRRFSEASNYIVNVQDLRNYLDEIGRKYPDSISIYYEQVNSGANISVNRDIRLFPASLSKLVQAILITKKVENGTWSWDKKLPTLPEDISSGSGNLYKTIGTQSLTVENLLEELLVNSDNTAQNIFRHYLDTDDYIKFQYETGLQDLYNENGFISAKEYSRLLRVLYGSTYLSIENSEKILQLMAEAKFHDYLSQGIPSGVTFAHKYGENRDYNIFADSGIVYVPGKPYFITVIIKGPDSSMVTKDWAESLMKDISEHAYNASK